jgi:hypothetical protein
MEVMNRCPAASRGLAASTVTALLLSLAGCSKSREGEVGAPSATALASSEAVSSAHVTPFVIGAKGITTIDMPGLKEHIHAETSAADGRLEVDLGNIANSRGEVKIDLTTLTTHTFDDADKNATQTKHARTWLEAVVDGKVDETKRWATFAVRSIDDLSAADVSKVAATPGASEDVRVVTATVHGEVLVHGHKVNRSVPVNLEFRYPAGAGPDATPTVLGIRTRQPMRLVLKEHEIFPRDPVGAALEWTAALVSKVAETADVSVDLTATPTLDSGKK